jgi:hypothetical protein
MRAQRQRAGWRAGAQRELKSGCFGRFFFGLRHADDDRTESKWDILEKGNSAHRANTGLAGSIRSGFAGSGQIAWNLRTSPQQTRSSLLKGQIRDLSKHTKKKKCPVSEEARGRCSHRSTCISSPNCL